MRRRSPILRDMETLYAVVALDDDGLILFADSTEVFEDPWEAREKARAEGLQVAHILRERPMTLGPIYRRPANRSFGAVAE